MPNWVVDIVTLAFNPPPPPVCVPPHVRGQHLQHHPRNQQDREVNLSLLKILIQFMIKLFSDLQTVNGQHIKM